MEEKRNDCPRCGKKMGKLAAYCNACGTKLPEQNNPDALAERGQRQYEIVQEFVDGLCGTEHHNLLAALAASEKQKGAYCPDCGKSL